MGAAALASPAAPVCRCAAHPPSVGVICGSVAAALVLIALGIAAVLLLRRRRRRRPKYMFDEPAAADCEKRIITSGGTGGTSGTNGTTGSSTISAELRKAAFHIDPKDIIIEQNEGGNMLLGRGAYGEVRRVTYTNPECMCDPCINLINWACKQAASVPDSSPGAPG